MQDNRGVTWGRTGAAVALSVRGRRVRGRQRARAAAPACSAGLGSPGRGIVDGRRRRRAAGRLRRGARRSLTWRRGGSVGWLRCAMGCWGCESCLRLLANTSALG